VFAVVALFSVNASATTVAPIDAQTAADLAGQVITGRVTSIRSYLAENPRRIESEVTLEQVEYLKGATAASTDSFTLIVPGGQVESMRMRIAGAPEFTVGQKWLLFLLPNYRTFPTVGVDQWAFRIETGGDGVERVYTTDGRGVTGIDENGFPRIDTTRAATFDANVVAASGLRVDPGSSLAAATAAIPYRDFVGWLRPVLSRSCDHGLTESAGKAIPSRTRPVPLRAVGGGKSSSAHQADGTDGALGRMPIPFRVPIHRTSIKDAGDGARP
jgi:hypothetical protein